MQSMVALIQREFLEHKGAFLYAPAVLLAIFTAALGSAVAFNRVPFPVEIAGDSALKFYEVASLGVGALWFIYLMAALFFYYADAFSADRRNNSMLFWKSMPQSDFKMLMSKMLAGLTVFPALIFLMVIATAIVIYALTAFAVTALPNLEVPGLGQVIASAAQVGWFSLAYLVLALLWYAPFFAWVGALSTMVGRWSIPLAFLIPGLAVLGENLFFRGVGRIVSSLLVPGGAPAGGYILDYLGYRSHFGIEGREAFFSFMGERQFDAVAMMARLLTTIDWAQMAGGVAVAAVLVYLASEYRRRVVVA